MTRFFFPPSESKDLALAPVCLWDSDQHYLRGTSWCTLTSTWANARSRSLCPICGFLPHHLQMSSDLCLQLSWLALCTVLCEFCCTATISCGCSRENEHEVTGSGKVVWQKATVLPRGVRTPQWVKFKILLLWVKLWIDKARAKDKRYKEVSVWWKTTN